MAIVAVVSKECSSTRRFMEVNGEVEVERPEECVNADCQLKEPLWKHGGYLRQVLYWGFAFLVYIWRFRCRRCGKTVSRPYQWLVPYRRFTAEVLATGIERYADVLTSYRDVGGELADLEFTEPALDIRDTRGYKRLEEEAAEQLAEKESVNEQEKIPWSKARWAGRDRGALSVAREKARRKGKIIEQRPAHTAVFKWLGFACEQSKGWMTQIQKELVREWKRSQKELLLPAESVRNANSEKAHTKEKAVLLHGLSYASLAAKLLVNRESNGWLQLRAYFFAKAESCKEIFSKTIVQFPTTHTIEPSIF